MPQKKNPDAAELIRAKIGRILGANVGLMTVMKGLPLTYSKDMQEDKEQVFDAADNLMLALAAMEGMVRDMAAQRERLAAAAVRVFDRHRPGRLAGAGAGHAVPRCASRHRALGGDGRGKGCDLPDLTLEEMQSVHGAIDARCL